MRKIFIVFDGPRGAFPVTIHDGENLIPFIEKYRANVAHVCTSATEAHYIAQKWNDEKTKKL